MCEKTNPLKAMSSLIKQTLDEDYKTMVKAGWLDTYSLNLTSKGVQVVLNRYLAKNKQAFAEMAKEELEEE